MSDPRGAAGGSATEIEPAHPDPDTSTGETSVDVGAPAAAEESRPEGPSDALPPTEPVQLVTEPGTDQALDASAHAHVLLDPLPPHDAEPDTPLFAAMSAVDDGAPDPDGATDPHEPETDTADLDEPDPGHPRDRPAAAGMARSVVGTDATGPVRHAHVATARVPWRRRRGVRIAAGTTIGLALLAASGLATYLYVSATAWRDHADSYLAQSRDLGEDLSRTRGDLAGAQAELDAVREQLTTAHQRITELASEKAQLSDDWEITQQLVDYQERVSDAAGQVALALDQCVQSQQELIGYLARAAEHNAESSTPAPYDPTQLAQFESDVEAFCQAASEANIALQRELAR